MFCYQCEQTANGKGCNTMGVCGKNPDVAALQDLLLYVTKGLAKAILRGKDLDVDTNRADRLMGDALFATVTNVDFDPERLVQMITDVVKERNQLKELFTDLGHPCQCQSGVGVFKPADTLHGMIEQAHQHGILDPDEKNNDIQSLKNTLIFGIKGTAAYAHHAMILGKEDEAIYTFLAKALSKTLEYDLSMNEWIDLLMEAGRINLRTMELLDQANTSHYGHPVPTKVPLGSKAGKAILVSGHDLHDLELLLEQTKGKGINVYTHGEMLPTHGYPELKKYPHFYGHYGTAWQNQQKEFSEFPGGILMTTNCIQKPQGSYQDNIFSTDLVGYPGVSHIADQDFSTVIEKALSMEGFKEDLDKGSVMVGFGHNTVLGIADKVIDAVKAGQIRHFFLVAGCDGAKPGRNYYTELVEKIPSDCVVLTLACGKFRFFDKQLGEIGGIPRLLDIGQCNDAYSAIKIASALAEAFDVDVNELPLSMILSWYEQKAVAILLTLLSLGIKNIRLGPTLPAFLSEGVLKFLVEQFNISPISTPDEDLKAILG